MERFNKDIIFISPAKMVTNLKIQLILIFTAMTREDGHLEGLITAAYQVGCAFYTDDYLM